MSTVRNHQSQNGLTLWLTGLPCAGKSTLAAQIGKELVVRGHQIEVLDGDVLRHTLCKDLGFSRSDRVANVIRIGQLCSVLGKSGIISIAAVIAPYREVREQLRASIPRFVEIYVRAPLDVCVQRDVKGMYAKALKGEISHFTGIDDPYEEPRNPEIIVDTDSCDIATCCRNIIGWVEQNGHIEPVATAVDEPNRFLSDAFGDSMILSLHVPKAAGNSFRQLLQVEFHERLMLDYGDWAGFSVPEALERCRIRTLEMRKRRDEIQGKYDVIHGHFVADKYLGLFPREDFVAFFRDPYQQALSHYCFLLRNPQREHLEEKMFHEAKMTLHDYLSWDAFHDQQSQYLGSIGIEDLAMAGLSEQFFESVNLFNSTFGCNLRGESFLNVNPDTTGAEYTIDQDVRKAVDKYRGADVELYRRAKEIFAEQTAKAGL